MYKRIIIVICILIFLFLLIPSINSIEHIEKKSTNSSFSEDSSISVVYYPTDDSKIRQNVPNKTHGSIELSTINTIDSNWECESLVKFDLSNIPTNAIVNNASLNIYYSYFNYNNPYGRELTIYKIEDNWFEETVTWNNKPTINDTITDSSFIYSINNWISWDVKENIQDYIYNGTQHLGWQIRDEVFSGIRYEANFLSKESESNIPYLIVDYKKANTVYVDDDYNSSTLGWQYDHFDVIQDGIDAVEVNGTVYVYNGMYYENVIVNKTIDLIGEDRNNTIINGSGVGDVIYISEDYVNFSHFTVKNSGTLRSIYEAGIDIESDYNTISDIHVVKNDFGILIDDSNFNMIHNVNASYNNVGIYLNSSCNNTISNCNMQFNNFSGINLWESSNYNNISQNIANNNSNGIALYESCSYNTIQENSIYENLFGIDIEFDCTHNSIIDNYVLFNSYGIIIESSSYNTITNNTNQNTWSGIKLGSSNNNMLIGNTANSHSFCGIILHSSSNNNTISRNYLSNNNAGIRITSSNNNIITCNNAINNDVGVGFRSSSRNNTISSNNISSNDMYGIRIQSSSNNNTISANNITSNTNDGIHIEYTSNISIEMNDIYDNYNGIYLGYSQHDTIISNHIFNNTLDGILLESESKYNIIDGNVVENNNGTGIYIEIDCDSTLIVKNTMRNNSDYGLAPTSMYNIAYHNNFINNHLKNAWAGNLEWDNGYPSGGNYWDDYTGSDQDGDGIGDLPYFMSIPGGSVNDSYPFIEENGWLKSIEVNEDTHNRGFPIRHALDGDWGAAQSFLTNNTLSRVDIFLRKFGTPEFNLIVELREDHPEGTLIETLIFAPEEVASNWEWLNIDFIDIITSPSTEYFIVCPPAPSGVTASFGYEWGYAFGNQYDDGAFWFTRDGGGLWRDLPTMYEFCFRTYGYS